MKSKRWVRLGTWSVICLLWLRASQADASAPTFCAGGGVGAALPHQDAPSSPCGGGGMECGLTQCTASPCYAATGTYTTSATDLSLPTTGFPLEAARVYSSTRVIDGPLGVGWQSSLTPRLYYATYLMAAPATFLQEAELLLPSGAF